MSQLTFDSSCNRVEQALIGLIVKEAKRMVAVAIARTSPVALDGADANYLLWFGAFDQSRAQFVHRTYMLIARALEGELEFVCSDKGKAYASVVPGFRRKIRLNPPFWRSQPKLGVSGLQSKPGTIIHELAHETLRGGDITYGVGNAQRLAGPLPEVAIRNAENYQLFAESL